MTDMNHDIDDLLRRNATQQLAGLDWDALRRGIGSRLTNVNTPVRSWNRYGQWGAIAAIVVLTTGILTVAVFSIRRPGTGIPVLGEAKVTRIEAVPGIGTAHVSFFPVGEPARCEVRMLPPDEPRPRSGGEVRWCIVVRQEAFSAESESERDASEVLCLF